jgi:hypothetical protein
MTLKRAQTIVPLWKRACPDLSGGIRGGFKTGFLEKSPGLRPPPFAKGDVLTPSLVMGKLLIRFLKDGEEGDTF